MMYISISRAHTLFLFLVCKSSKCNVMCAIKMSNAMVEICIIIFIPRIVAERAVINCIRDDFIGIFFRFQPINCDETRLNDDSLHGFRWAGKGHRWMIGIVVCVMMLIRFACHGRLLGSGKMGNIVMSWSGIFVIIFRFVGELVQKDIRVLIGGERMNRALIVLIVLIIVFVVVVRLRVSLIIV